MTVTLSPFAYYARHGCALFPIKQGSKDPFGIVESFKRNHSADPMQWQAWSEANPGCNFGVVAFASRLIVADVDTKDLGRDAAWALWCEVCASWGIPVAMPHVQSARGGWHIYFVVPPEVDTTKLRQPDAVKKYINLRCIGYVVAAGSVYNDPDTGASLPYTLLTEAPPYPAPAALIEHCTRRPAPARTSATPAGSLDIGDTAKLLTWLAERGQFEAYEDWLSIGMALRIEFGDAGLSLWELCHDETVTPDTAASKWDSFATEPDAHSVTIMSWLKKAHELSWKGTIKRSTQAMFGDAVAQMASAAGATLPGAVPMLAGQEELTRLATPMLEEFLAATKDAPTRPMASDLPALPPQMSGHGLFASMDSSLTRIFSLAEAKSFKPSRVTDPLIVLGELHQEVFDQVCRRLRGLGHTLQDRKIHLGRLSIREQVERITVTLDKWEYDKHGEVQSDNPDNVIVLLGYLGVDIRWNAWLDRAEVQGGNEPDLRWPEWTYLDDQIVARLMTRAKRTKTRFRPAKDFLWDTLLTIAHQHSQDPVRDQLDALATAWDRTPRLVTWLATYCGTPCDVYHQAVGKLIVAGMVARARNPGCKFDFMPVFFGPQGTGKSTMAALLALNPAWFTNNVLLGDAAKELILTLAGKLVVEIDEMGTRGNTNAAHVKAMISRQVDAGRTAYARAVTERPRRNIFIGTTNDSQPLSDPTGNRRFLPVRIDREIDLAGLAAIVPQLIGEAAALNHDATLPREIWEAATGYQEAARQASDVEVLFADWFGTDTHAFVTVADLVRLCDSSGRRNMGQVSHFIMKGLGFTESVAYVDAKKTRVWYRSGAVMLPKQVATLPRYRVDVTGGMARVVLRMEAAPAVPGRPAL